MAQYDSEGHKTFVNSITDEEKDSLTAAEQEHLLPDLDPYNNKLIMSLKVRNLQTGVTLCDSVWPCVAVSAVKAEGIGLTVQHVVTAVVSAG